MVPTALDGPSSGLLFSASSRPPSTTIWPLQTIYRGRGVKSVLLPQTQNTPGYGARFPGPVPQGRCGPACATPQRRRNAVAAAEFAPRPQAAIPALRTTTAPLQKHDGLGSSPKPAKRSDDGAGRCEKYQHARLPSHAVLADLASRSSSPAKHMHLHNRSISKARSFDLEVTPWAPTRLTSSIFYSGHTEAYEPLRSTRHPARAPFNHLTAPGSAHKPPSIGLHCAGLAFPGPEASTWR